MSLWAYDLVENRDNRQRYQTVFCDNNKCL